MDRRTILRRAGAVGALALAGCMGEGTADPADDGASGDGDPTDDGTTTPAMTIQTETLEVTDTGPGSESDGAAEVDFQAAEDTVRVTGTIVGSDGCKTAVLEDATYDAGADELTVSVVTEDEAGSEDKMCTQALVAIDYTVTITISGGIPGEVSVSHDGAGVASAAHDSTSAGPD